LRFKIYLGLTVLYYDLDVLIHTIFVIKYWVLSKRLEAISHGIMCNEKKIMCQLCVLLGFQIFLFLAAIIEIPFLSDVDTWTILVIVSDLL
jgi:hypothetical protein